MLDTKQIGDVDAVVHPVEINEWDQHRRTVTMTFRVGELPESTRAKFAKLATRIIDEQGELVRAG